MGGSCGVEQTAARLGMPLFLFVETLAELKVLAGLETKKEAEAFKMQFCDEVLPHHVTSLASTSQKLGKWWERRPSRRRVANDTHPKGAESAV